MISNQCFPVEAGVYPDRSTAPMGPWTVLGFYHHGDLVEQVHLYLALLPIFILTLSTFISRLVLVQ